MPPKKVVQSNRKTTEKMRSIRKDKSHLNMPANFKVSIPFKSSDREGLQVPIVKGRRPPMYTKHLDTDTKVDLANSVARQQLVKEEPPAFQVDNVVVIKEPKRRQTRGRKKKDAVVSDFFLNRVITETTPAEVSSTDTTQPQKDTTGKKHSPNKPNPSRKILTRKRVADKKAQDVEKMKCAKIEPGITELLKTKIKVEDTSQTDLPEEPEFEHFVELPAIVPPAPAVEEATPAVEQEEPKVAQVQPKKSKPTVKRLQLTARRTTTTRQPAPARKRGPKGKQQNAEPHIQTPSIVDLLKHQAAEAEEKLKLSQQNPPELVEANENSVGSNSNKSWTRDISTSSNNTCIGSIGSNDFVRIDKKLPVLKLTNIDSEVKKRQNEALKAASAVIDEAGEDLSVSYESDSSDSRQRKLSEQLNDSLGANSVHLSASSSSQFTYSRRKETSDYDKAANKLSHTMEKLDLEIIQWMGSETEDVNDNLVKFRDKMYDILDREFGVITHCRHLKAIMSPQSKENIDDVCVPERIRDSVSNAGIERYLGEENALFKERTPIKERSPVKESTRVKKSSLVKESVPVKEGARVKASTPVKVSAPVKKNTPVKESAPYKQSAPVKESAGFKESALYKQNDPVKESALYKQRAPVKQSAPAKESTGVKESALYKQSAPVKESAPFKESALYKQSAPVKENTQVKENTSVKDNTAVEKNTKELEKEFVVPRRPSRHLSCHSEGNVSTASTRASRDSTSDDEPAAPDNPDYDHHDDDDTLSLFAESISGFESRMYTPASSAIVSRPPPVEEYVPQPVKEVSQPNTEKQTYCPTKITEDTQMLASQVTTVCEKQNADSTSIFKQSNSTDDAESYQDFTEDIYLDTRLDAVQDMIKTPRLMDSFFEVLPKTRSIVFGNLCFYNLMNCCRNYYTGVCRFVHVVPTSAQMKEKLNQLDERMLIQEYLLVRRWVELRRRYGMCFVEECAKRGLTRILIEMAYDFIVKATNDSEEDTRLRVDTIEVTLLHLNSVDLSICEDLLKLPIHQDQANRTLLCDVFMATMSITQNFTRFKVVFLTLTYFMVDNDRTFNKDVVEHILERVCILPFDEPVARALIQMMRLTKAEIFNNSMIGHFEKQISVKKDVFEEYSQLKNQCALSSLLASSLASPAPPPPEPDTTHLDNMNKATEELPTPVITRTIGMNPPIIFNQRNASPSDSRTHLSPGPSHSQISPSQYYANTGPSQPHTNNTGSDSSDNSGNIRTWRNRSIYPHALPPPMANRGGMLGPPTRGTPTRGTPTRGTHIRGIPTRGTHTRGIPTRGARGTMRPPMRPCMMRPPQRLPFNQRLVTFKSPSNFVIRQSGPKY